MVIDWKYKIAAHNPCSGNVHTEKDAILFLAKDKAVPAMLRAYHDECQRLKTNPAHLEAITLLLGRVEAYQRDIENKVPDTDLPCEVDRCTKGKGVDDGPISAPDKIELQSKAMENSLLLDPAYVLTMEDRYRNGEVAFLGTEINRMLALAGYPSDYRRQYKDDEVWPNTGGIFMAELCRIAKSNLGI